MEETLESSAVAAFGRPDTLPAASVESESFEVADPDDDTQPTTKLISKIQRPNLNILEKIIQFVPKEYSKGSAIAEQPTDAAKNAEIADVKILSQFKLRYLCRRFRNIVHKRTPLTLNRPEYSEHDCNFHLSDQEGIRLSRDKSFDQFPGPSNRSNSDSVFSKVQDHCVRNRSTSLGDNICSLELDFDSHHFQGGHSWDPAGKRNHDDILSFPALLSRLTEAIERPLSLSLYVEVADICAGTAFVKDFHVPLKRQIPSVELEKLRLDSRFEVNDMRSMSRSLKYLLEFGQQSLVLLDVNIFILQSVFAAAANDGILVPAASWQFPTLETLTLHLRSCRGIDVDNDSRAAFVVFCTTLPSIFPGLKMLALHWENPDIDLSGFRGFEGLLAVELGVICPTDEQFQQLTLLNSTSVRSLSLAATEELLLKVRMDLPSLTSLTYLVGESADAFTVLKQRLDSVNGSFQLLQELIFSSYGEVQLPPYPDFILLLGSLQRLPHLTSLRFELDPDFFYERWCPPGRLSIVQELPETLTNASFIFVLLPTGVIFDMEDTFEYCLEDAEDGLSCQEAIYKDWIRSLLCRIAEHPRLERFHCVCMAPSFEAIDALAEKWSKSAAAAIADLSLRHVVHVQCSPKIYARMDETRLGEGERYKFRFVLEPRLKPGNTVTPKRRVDVTVVFEKPN